MKFYTILLTSTILLCLFSCNKIFPPSPEKNEVMDNAIDGLTYDQNRLFLEGAEEFDEIYVPETGLGPIFVASSCASCHSGDNKGHVFTALTRFGQKDTFENTFLKQGGPQLQENFIIGFKGEQLPANATFSKFVAPIVSGSGLLELVSDQDILKMADPQDLDGDGISGRPNWNTIPDWVEPNANSIVRDGKYICRFGKKASTYNIHQQVTQAFNQDMGVTTSFLPQNPYNHLSGLNSIITNDPDLTDNQLNATVFYIQALQVPERRDKNNPSVLNGEKIFKQIKCNSCHVEELKSAFSPIAALSYKTFYPYTDLLLHDMGAELDDHYTEGTALTNEWRTAPLWGLGLSTASQGGKYFLMHDGRAKSIDESILMHNGESLKSKNDYMLLSAAEKNDLTNFLKSL